MAVSPFPRYWVEKKNTADHGVRWYGKCQLTDGAIIQLGPWRKSKAAALDAILELHPRLCACGCGEDHDHEHSHRHESRVAAD